MQEHAYPASNQPLIFSRIMVGILDDDVIEVRILYRLHHTGIPIKVLDVDKVVQRAAAVDPCRCVAHVPHASRVPRRRLGHCWANRARHPRHLPQFTPSQRTGRMFSARRRIGHTLRSRDLPVRLILEAATQDQFSGEESGFQACASNPAVTLANAAFASCSSTRSSSSSSRPLT
jgi:hypothetical protein